MSDGSKRYCGEFALSDGVAYDRLVEMLFCENDSVNLYSVATDLADERPYFAELTPVIGLVRSGEHCGDAFKITFDTSRELKEYFLNLRSLCASLKDRSLKYAPFIYFTDTEFVKRGKPTVSFCLKTNQIKADPGLAERAAAIYAQSMPLDPDYIKIKSNFDGLPDGRKRYFLRDGIRLIKNLFVYLEREKAQRGKDDNSAKLLLLSRLLPKKEWINAAAYKQLAAELFGCLLSGELDYCEDFLDIYRFHPKIDKCVKKLEFYLNNELHTPPCERSYYS